MTQSVDPAGGLNRWNLLAILSKCLSICVHRRSPRHIQRVLQEPGPIAERFPQPTQLTDALLREAYRDLGLSARQMELITGHSTEHIIPALTQANIAIRPGGRASPWLARQ